MNFRSVSLVEINRMNTHSVSHVEIYQPTLRDTRRQKSNVLKQSARPAAAIVKLRQAGIPTI